MSKARETCRFCNKKFKSVKMHVRFCKAQPQPPIAMQQETKAVLSPYGNLIKAANEYWEQLSDQQKLRACAFVSYTGDRGLI